MKNQIIFLPGLNGIRTIAALGVLFSHVNLALKSFGIFNISLFGFTEDGDAKAWPLGAHGVTMFFVLSGFLITYLLLKEFEETKTINVKKFYIRRILRIWPLYFAYIIVTLILMRDYISLDYNLIYYLTFFANIPFVQNHGYTGMHHLWSISVEEQFYLFWPLLFLFCIRRNGFFRLTSIIIIALMGFRVLAWYFLPYSQIALFSVVNRFDCMLFGALGAYLFFHNNKIIDLFNSMIVQFLSWGIIGLLIFCKLNVINSLVEMTIVEFVTLVIIIGQIKVVHRVVNLENKLFSYIGRLSFGLYVYHPLMILILSKNMNFKLFESNVINSILVFTSVLFVSLIISHLSYFYFEKWFLNRKVKFSVIESSNTKIVN